MRIGFDIDGTLTNFEEFVRKHATIYMKKKYQMDLKNSSGYDVDQMFDLENELIKRNIDLLEKGDLLKKYRISNKSLAKREAEVQRNFSNWTIDEKAAFVSKTIMDGFWTSYYPRYCIEPFRACVAETINRLYDEGHEIYIFSSRKKACSNDLIGRFVRASLKHQFPLNGVKYHKIVLLPDDAEKSEAIKSSYIDIMVDDKPELIRELSGYADLVCISSPYNVGADLSGGKYLVKRASSYENNEVYNAIQELISANKEPLKNNGIRMTGIPSIDKPWLKHYTKGDLKWSLTRKSPYYRIMQNSKYFPRDNVLSYFGNKMTYGELEEKVESCAKKLIADGIGKGDIVPLLVANTPETRIMIYALMRVMATIMPISPLESQKSMESKIERVAVAHGTPKMLYFVDSWNLKEKRHTSDKVRELCTKFGIRNVVYTPVSNSMPVQYKIGYRLKTAKEALKNRVFIPASNKAGYTHFNEYCASGRRIDKAIDIKYCNDFIAAIVHTGGTVEPKSVMITPENIDAEISHFLNTKIGTKRGEKITGFLPWDHIYGLLINLFVPDALGMESIVHPKPDRKQLHEFFTKEKANYFVGIPVLIDELIVNPHLKEADLSCVKQVFTGSETISPSELKRTKGFFKERNADIKQIDGFGMTETTAMVLENGVPTIGTDIMVVEPGTQKELGYNEVGELCVTGPNITTGYYLDDARNARMLQLHDDGRTWLHTGDLSSINEDGRAEYAGRVDRDIIKVNGHSVNLYSIGKIVEQHPAISKCVVFGAMDRKKGKVPVAVVKLKDDYNDEDEAVRQDIVKRCNENLSYFERPSSLLFMDDLPLTFRGKVDTKSLETIFSDVTTMHDGEHSVGNGNKVKVLTNGESLTGGKANAY